MKKLFLHSLTPILLSISTISCTKNIEQKQEKNVKNESKLYENEHIAKMLKSYTSNKSDVANIYISQQENLPYSKFSELKYAFVYDPIFISKSVHNVGGEYQYLANTSKNVIKNTLSKDWYWTLNNIDKFKFIFNPYGDRYRAFNIEEKLFEHVKNELGSLIYSIKNTTPTKLITIPFQEIEQVARYNKFQEKETWYLVYNNVALRIFKYKHNGNVVIQIHPDLLYFKDATNIENELKSIEKEIYEKRKSKFEKDYQEEKESAAEFEDEEFNEEQFIQQYTDDKFMEFQGIYQYNDYFVDALNSRNKINTNSNDFDKDQFNIIRFSMRFVNE
ncbi:lipoprotein [Mycoplasmopsis bovigenitalium]|uniref:aromatic motif membrane protein n=1 Tax=Mycoplasmopsis bovigenitalium TaxID=2112 RepID=UPI00090B9911|nr:aromatic motif membrane protein [Mycoplasmopsis bovigenitalium]BAW18482.1 lipoprotein [Mycoplasmopsis bovigenitalium]